MTAAERCKAHESLRLTVYDDFNGLPIGPGSVVKGYPTIGYGRLVCAPGGITEGEANGLFVNSWNAATAGAATLPAYAKLDPVRQGVLIELVFWLGLRGLQAFHKMLGCLGTLDYNGASDALLNSHLHTQAKARCEELAQLLKSGE